MKFAPSLTPPTHWTPTGCPGEITSWAAGSNIQAGTPITDSRSSFAMGAEKIQHKKITMGSALGHGMWSFVKHYVFKLGFLDGWAGFVIALGNFEGTFYRYVKALEVQKGAQWQAPTSLNNDMR